jgi:hypothetical protein
MRPLLQRLIVVAVGLLLLVAPLFVRTVVWGYNNRPYPVGQVPLTSVAATPVPTATAVPLSAETLLTLQDMRPGPVVVDLAHGNRLNRSQFEPLAAALARRGLGLRFWISDIDILSLTSYLDFPDQSEELASLLGDASALVVASPFFLWSPAEIALVERFVADGGHLLLVSDPDVEGDLAQDINNLGEPFGVVFNDDYLYDTAANDGNFTYIFLGEYLDQATRLVNKRIAFYGARSISGEVTPQVRSAATTLSSLRTGVTSFTTVALAGLHSRGTAGRVLALSDFDVMTAPYVERHENLQLVEYVAAFLVAAERQDTVSDFPAYLGKRVALIFGNAEAVDAKILLEGARVQAALEASGRELVLAGTSLLTETLEPAGRAPEFDLFVLADFGMIDEQTTLLRRLGFRRVEVTPEPSPTPAAPDATPTPMPEDSPAAAAVARRSDHRPSAPAPLIALALLVGPPSTITVAAPAVDTAQEVTGSLEITATAPAPAAPAGLPPVTATPEATATPDSQPTVYLETDDGLRLLARQTVIIAQVQLPDQHRLVAVLGNDNGGIRAGVDRLLGDNYDGCVKGIDLVVCSYEGAPEPPPGAAPGAATPTPSADITPTPDAEAEPSAAILIVDDNDMANPNDASEADTYLAALAQAGYQPALWATLSQGPPGIAELSQYKWVIWSSGGYENGGPGLADLDAMLAYINSGGWLTVSSRRPFFGMSTEDPSAIVDIVIDDDVPALVAGLPSEIIALPNGLPPVVPLETNGGPDSPQVALRRGPDSGSPGAPLLFLATDEGDPEATGARLMILGMAVTWLPDGYDQQLVKNMAAVMLSAE